MFDSQPNDRPVLKYWCRETGGEWVSPIGPGRGSVAGETRSDWPPDLGLPTSGNVVDHCTAESLDHFLDHIKQDRKSCLGFESMRVVQDINFAAQASAEIGAPVSIPASREELEASLG